VGLQESRCRDTWTCSECGKVVEGRRNTIHLGVISHWRKHRRDNGEDSSWRGFPDPVIQRALKVKKR